MGAIVCQEGPIVQQGELTRFLVSLFQVHGYAAVEASAIRVTTRPTLAKVPNRKTVDWCESSTCPSVSC